MARNVRDSAIISCSARNYATDQHQINLRYQVLQRHDNQVHWQY